MFTVTDEVVEAAAKAACEFAYPPTSPDGRVKRERSWDEIEDWEQDSWRGTARAALEAARTAQPAPMLDREAAAALLHEEFCGGSFEEGAVFGCLRDAHRATYQRAADAILALVPQPAPVLEERTVGERWLAGEVPEDKLLGALIREDREKRAEHERKCAGYWRNGKCTVHPNVSRDPEPVTRNALISAYTERMAGGSRQVITDNLREFLSKIERRQLTATSPTVDDYVRATAEAVGVDPDEAVEHRRRTVAANAEWRAQRELGSQLTATRKKLIEALTVFRSTTGTKMSARYAGQLAAYLVTLNHVRPENEVRAEELDTFSDRLDEIADEMDYTTVPGTAYDATEWFKALLYQESSRFVGRAAALRAGGE